MKFTSYGYFLSIILGLACSGTPSNKIPGRNKIGKKEYFKKKPSSNFSDTLKINFSAAVFYSPDSLQLEKIRSLTDARVYEGSMHEYYNYIRNAHLVIKRDKPQLKIIEAKNVRYLLFIKADKSQNCIDLDKQYDPYGLFIFDRQNPARLLDMANIESELGFYFTK